MLVEALLEELDEKTLYGYVRMWDDRARVIVVNRPGAMPKVGQYIQVAYPGNDDDSIQAFFLPPPTYH